MPMTPEEIASCLSVLKEKTELKNKKIKLAEDQDEVDLLQAFLDDPGKIEMDGLEETVVKNRLYKKIALYAHPDKLPPEIKSEIYFNAMDDYLRLDTSDRLRVQALIRSERQPSQTPATFRTMFENVNFTNEYQAIKNLSFAQKLHLHHHLREEQIQLLDMIEKALLSDNKMNDADHAQVFYSVLTLAQNNLQHEFRWTEWLGFPTKSRLEDIIQRHIGELSTGFPNIKPLANKEQLKAVLVEKALTSIEEHIDKLLKPHGFLLAVKAFLKEGLLNLSQPPKPKS